MCKQNKKIPDFICFAGNAIRDENVQKKAITMIGGIASVESIELLLNFFVEMNETGRNDKR